MGAYESDAQIFDGDDTNPITGWEKLSQSGYRGSGESRPPVGPQIGEKTAAFYPIIPVESQEPADDFTKGVDFVATARRIARKLPPMPENPAK